MAIPTFEQMLRPLLAFAAERNVTRQDMTQAIADYFKLTEEDREARIPSGQAHVCSERRRLGNDVLDEGRAD
jgi:restriction endonuclease Mrr